MELICIESKEKYVSKKKSITLRCRVADTSATRTMSAASPRSATGSATGVRLLAGKECAGKTVKNSAYKASDSLLLL